MQQCVMKEETEGRERDGEGKRSAGGGKCYTIGRLGGNYVVE